MCTSCVHCLYPFCVSTWMTACVFVSYSFMDREGPCCSLLLYNTYCITTGSVWVAPAIWRDATPAVTDTTHSMFVCLCMHILFVSTRLLQIDTASSTVVRFLGSCTWQIKGRQLNAIHILQVFVVCIETHPILFIFAKATAVLLQKIKASKTVLTYRDSSLYLCVIVLWGFDSWQQTVKTSLSGLAGARVSLFHS